MPEATQPGVARGKGIGFFRRFSSFPKEILVSPGGVILFTFALIMEIADWIPGGSFTWELIPEIIYMFFLKVIAGVSWIGMLIPFLIERIPGVSDVIPTWVIHLLGI